MQIMNSYRGMIRRDSQKYLKADEKTIMNGTTNESRDYATKSLYNFLIIFNNINGIVGSVFNPDPDSVFDVWR